MISLVFYKDRDNTQDLVFADGRIPLDITAVNRFVLESGGFTLESSTAPALFEWPVTVEQGPHTGKTALRLKLGASALVPETYFFNLISYDADNPNGLVWDDSLEITII